MLNKKFLLLMMLKTVPSCDHVQVHPVLQRQGPGQDQEDQGGQERKEMGSNLI